VVARSEAELRRVRWSVESVGGLGEWVAILTPRSSDSVMYRYDKQRPDSAAAQGEQTS
jgi:hypothetical protein